MKKYSLYIKNTKPYPIRVMVDLTPGSRKKHQVITSLGVIGPLTVDERTYQVLQKNIKIQLHVGKEFFDENYKEKWEEQVPDNFEQVG